MYDFLNDELPEGERVPYKLIRWWFLDCYYTYCRSKIHHRGTWSQGEREIGYAYEQEESAFYLPIEKLMLETITLILDANRGPDAFKPYHHARIAEILEKHDLNDMLSSLPEEERREFEHDLRLLNILS